MTLSGLLSYVDGDVYCDIYDAKNNKTIATDCLVEFIGDILIRERIGNKKVSLININSSGNLEIWIK